MYIKDAVAWLSDQYSKWIARLWWAEKISAKASPTARPDMLWHFRWRFSSRAPFEAKGFRLLQCSRVGQNHSCRGTWSNFRKETPQEEVWEYSCFSLKVNDSWKCMEWHLSLLVSGVHWANCAFLGFSCSSFYAWQNTCFKRATGHAASVWQEKIHVLSPPFYISLLICFKSGIGFTPQFP